jgi:crotonobetainyl-CoA:carnitine CoA-transferase CaiB-like acyl-CoA transferase
MKQPGPLTGVVVAGLGTRLAVRACGSLLAQLGASVVMLEPLDGAGAVDPAQRAPLAYGTYSVGWRAGNAADLELAERTLARADIVITSSDVDRNVPAGLLAVCRTRPVHCNVTATGSTGPLAGQPLTDAMVQALTGIMDTTGLVGGPPVQLGMPVVELSAGIYSALGIVTAWRVWRTQGIAQTLDMALYDIGVNTLTTFLPGHFGGGVSSRLGNGHSMGVPWNAYATSDGWVLICSTSDDHWRKMCELVGDPALGTDARYSTLGERVSRREEVDGLMTSWTGRLTVAECLARLEPAGIACGAIVTMADLPREPNLIHRRRITRTRDPVSGSEVVLMPSVIGSDDWDRAAPARIPAPDGDRAALDAVLAMPALGSAKPSGTPTLPLAGMRVLEIGQFTTAPLVCRHLSSLGAEVLKIEPPTGDTARQWKPHRAGLSLFFVMSNSGKKSLAVDLRSPDGRQLFADLVASADCLVENLKPGSLARLGFSYDELKKLNPRIVYCPISGFGADSAYDGKAAFDTVVQAMCGIMDATRSRGIPLKVGASIADIFGGQLGLLSVLAAIEQRDRTGVGRYIDVSMQDAGAWLTQPLWNVPAGSHVPAEPVACNDGYVVVDVTGPAPSSELVARAASMTRAQWLAACAAAGVRAAPVQSVGEVVAHPQTVERKLIVYKTTAEGVQWELLGSPLKLNVTPPRAGDPIGPPQPPTPALLAELGLRTPATR